MSDESPLPPVINTELTKNPVFEETPAIVNDVAVEVKETPVVSVPVTQEVKETPVVSVPVTPVQEVKEVTKVVPVTPNVQEVTKVVSVPVTQEVKEVTKNVTPKTNTIDTIVNIANIASTVSTTVTNAIKASNVASIDASAAQISQAVITDVATISQDINNVAQTAKDLYKSPLSTILTICGRSLLKDTAINSSNILLVAHDVMESIETLKTLQVMKNMTSEQKKQLALDCLHWLVNNSDELSVDEKATINLLVTTVVPNTIDVMIAISNGESELVTVGSRCCVIS